MYHVTSKNLMLEYKLVHILLTSADLNFLQYSTLSILTASFKSDGISLYLILENAGRIDSPESPETPEITEMIEKFIKVTKNLTKLREMNKLSLRKISLLKTVRMKLSVDSGFSNVFYGKKRKPGNAGNQQKVF